MSRVRPFISSLLTITLMSVSPHVLANSVPNPFASAKRMIGDHGAAYQGSDPYVKCQAYGNDTWDKLLNKQDRWDGAWFDVTDKGTKAIQESLTKVINSGANVTQAELDDLKTKTESAFSQGHLLRMELLKCEAYLGLTKDFDGYGDGEATVKTSTKSFDGQIKCETAGAETQDYTGCVSALTIYNGAAVAQTGMNTYQQVDYMGHQMDQTQKVQENANSATVGLEVQRDSMEKQGSMATQLAALDGARAGAFMAALGNIPTREDIINSCKNSGLGSTIDQQFQKYVSYFETDLIKRFATSASITFKEHQYGNTKEDAQKLEAQNSGFTYTGPEQERQPAAQEGEQQPVAATVEILKPQLKLTSQSLAQNCDRVGSQANALTMNGKARDAMKQAAIAAGIEMAANLGKAAIFNKYAGKLDDAIGGVQSFEEELAAAPTFMDGTFTECQTNPSASGCPALTDDRVVDYYSGGININGNSAATTGEIAGNLGEDSSAIRDTGTTGTKVTGPIASPGKISDSNGNEIENIAPKASVTSSESGNPGGGGGGGPGSASAPAGGSAQAYNEDGESKQGTGVKTGAPGYSGVTAVSMSTGGRAPASNNKDKPENPFANMFGKNGGSDAVNFRGVASNDIGAKGGSVFDMISRRYNNVQEQKRLIEYQMK